MVIFGTQVEHPNFLRILTYTLNMNKPWFGRKKLGWGWGLPQTWQGWMVIVLFITTIISFRFISNTPFMFIALVILAVIMLFIVAWLTSGKPQWGVWLSNSKNKKIIITLYAVILIIVLYFGLSQFLLLQKAHSTFENYYAFRGCFQLLERTPDYGICKIASGQTIKIVKIQNKWYLDGDGPGVW